MPSNTGASKRRSTLRSVSVRQELTQRIEAGRLQAGARLPSEPELAAELGVSRATLREALRSLEGEGLLRRMWGSGTFVAESPRVANSLDLNFGVTDSILAAGMEAGVEQGRSWVEPAAAGEAERLRMEPGHDVVVIERVRTADGTPVVVSRDVLPQRLVDGRDDLVAAMCEESIYEVLERDLGIVIQHGVASFRPVKADRSVAGLLGVARGELLLYLWQVDYAEDGEPVLSSHEYHLAGAFEFSVVRRGPGRRLT
jgi:GntR family transcriptional regulator